MNQPPPDFDAHWQRLLAANPALANPACRMTLSPVELRRLLARAWAGGGTDPVVIETTCEVWLRFIAAAAFLDGLRGSRK